MDQKSFEEWLQKTKQGSEQSSKEIQKSEQILEYYEKLEEARATQILQLRCNSIKREV